MPDDKLALEKFYLPVHDANRTSTLDIVHFILLKVVIDVPFL